MIVLVDADLVAYRCAASCEPTKIKPEREPLDRAIERTSELVYRILSTLACKEHRFFISGDENFRKVLDPSYKANRVQPKPEYLNAIRSLLIEEWDAEVCAGYEADDGIGIAHTPEAIICSIDKDLRQIPGWHFNFVKNELTEVNEWDSIRSFYSQMLTGDRSDNVIGIEGIGPVRAERILSGATPSTIETIVWDCYREAGKSREQFCNNYCLLRIIRSVQELEYLEDCQRKGQRPDITEINSFRYIGNISKFDGE